MYDDKTFTPDGSAQLWAVGLWTGRSEDETFVCSAPVVGWFAVDSRTMPDVTYHLPAVQDISSPMHVESLEEWGKEAKLVELVHVSDLACRLKQYNEHAETYLAGLAERKLEVAA